MVSPRAGYHGSPSVLEREVTAAALGMARVPLPFARRRPKAPAHGTSQILGIATLIVVLLPWLLAMVFPVFRHVAFGMSIVALPIGAVAVVATLPAPPVRARPTWFSVGALFALAIVAWWLLLDPRGNRAMSILPIALWPIAGLLLQRGVGREVPRLLLWAAMVGVLAAALLWANLLFSTQAQPAAGTQVDVFAGWPWPAYLGAVRYRMPPADQGVAFAWCFDYAVMVGAAALLLARAKNEWLSRWLPGGCWLLAVLHLVGSCWLVIATDG